MALRGDNTGLGNGLLHDSIKPLPEPMLTWQIWNELDKCRIKSNLELTKDAYILHPGASCGASIVSILKKMDHLLMGILVHWT